MPTNDPVQDAFNPPGNLSHDFEKFTFGELEIDELFWQTNTPEESNPWRKVSQTEGLNLKTNTKHNFMAKTKVFQRI